MISAVPRYVLVTVGVVWVLAALAACGRVWPAAGPRLTLWETERNLGVVLADRETEFVFGFSNTGDRPLEIKGVEVLPASPGG